MAIAPRTIAEAILMAISPSKPSSLKETIFLKVLSIDLTTNPYLHHSCNYN
jgi:hypothetical protein